jgi:hypothetical protein
LEGRYGAQKYPILLENVLHIPAPRSNLISGIQLDKAGVITTLGNGTIVLSFNDKPIIGGSIVNEMYCLNLEVVRPQLPSLSSRLGPPSLSSHLGPKVLFSNTGSMDFYTT